MTDEEVAVLKENLQAFSIEPAMEETAVDLRGRDVIGNLGGEIVCVMTPFPRLYAWAPSSLLTDNGIGVLKPSPLNNALAGRWLLLSRGILFGSVTQDFGNLVDGDGTGIGFSVPGTEMGDFVICSCSVDLQGITVTAYVNSPDNAALRLQNESGGAVDLPSATFRVIVFKK